MCKTWNIVYACKHTVQIRLSTCGGSFTTQSRKASPPKSACHSGPLLALHPIQACGPCQLTNVQNSLYAKVEALQAVSLDANSWSAPPNPELEAAEEEYRDRCFAISRNYPSQRYEKYARPEKRRVGTRGGYSLLRCEVRPEDIPEHYRTEQAGWDGSWGSGWKTMEEDLAETEAEKPSGAWFGSELDDEMPVDPPESSCGERAPIGSVEQPVESPLVPAVKCLAVERQSSYLEVCARRTHEAENTLLSAIHVPENNLSVRQGPDCRRRLKLLSFRTRSWSEFRGAENDRQCVRHWMAFGT
ncbi:hypothetical protein BAUCODRAFT_22092 [Baudoinia panamericana UAMH 10762]|uniref:Uncharacterized protein n=1 Tax=Baudoinia panamericana (strain UAMH 10762) TaxID=717646 RepID=M2NI29_BAUPA|nr:uncharacterized protein BAUCODRAFT_22092 [Baudoinia panamericana UAMH 10762]EMC98745.1 hypothetical protein BAUCODRAFT_22092 [Baudoinia panamericana UAMH 10762]